MEESLTFDQVFMQKALELGERARLLSPPNPWVGCVIVNHGRIVGEGFTQPPGSAHAEIMALNQAKELSQGATAYTTLEPCSHFGRTPPCAEALIKAGIARVVIGVTDPDSNVAGRGITKLREGGISVTTGILNDAIALSLAPYLHHRIKGIPYCLLKGASSLDGRIAAKDGSSQWITSLEARQDAHRLRAESQAILIGSGTARADLPALTVRDVPTQPINAPVRIVLDAKGELPAKGPLFDTNSAPTWIITTSACSQSIIDSWKKHGVRVEIVPPALNGKGVDLNATMLLLGKNGILQVLIEGGSTIHGAFLEAGLINRLVVYIGGKILGQEGLPLFSTKSISTLDDSPQLKLLGTRIFDNCVRLDYEL